MLRGAFLIAGVAGFALMIAFGSQIAIFAAFGVLFGNFATVCLQYNDAMDRARARVAGRLGRLHPNSDAHQRLESQALKPTAEDRQHQMNAMTSANLATGIACLAFCAWGLYLWVV